MSITELVMSQLTERVERQGQLTGRRTSADCGSSVADRRPCIRTCSHCAPSKVKLDKYDSMSNKPAPKVSAHYIPLQPVYIYTLYYTTESIASTFP